MEKLAFTLVTTARKLKPYFQAHTVVVLTKKPLGKAMSSPKAAGRMTLWAIELSEFDIQYRPQPAIKGQIIADFIAEFTNTNEQGARRRPKWIINTNKSLNKHSGRAGVVLYSLEGDKVECMIRLDFPATNNEAEYKAIITGLDLAQVAAATNVTVYCNSQVVTSQVNDSYECRGEQMKEYLEYGIPRVLISNNGKQFDNNAFKGFCSQLGIKNHYSSPAHPQVNGQVEVTN
ncbi:uncharacterized protein LOC142612316 [Castanea sativa]|uniref:uncharacterized protein LOC142612316 n=1 Tax=Castanea sativa TaxID=21020 RepID=UPI003F652331